MNNRRSYLSCVVVIALLGAMQAFAITEAQVEYTELKRIMAESKAWDVSRLQKESITPEVMLPATEKYPAMVALKQALALAKDLSGAGVNVSKEKAALEALQSSCETGQSDEASFTSVVAIRRTLAFKNPLLNFKSIVFQKHNKPFDKMSSNGKAVSRGENHMIDQYLGFNQIKGGGIYVLENPFSEKPTARNVLSQPVVSGRLQGKKLGDEGSFVGLDLDYDASRIVFAYTEAEWGVDINQKLKASGKEHKAEVVDPVVNPDVEGRKAGAINTSRQPNIPDDWDWTDQPAGPRKSGGQPAHAKHYYWKKESAFHIFSANVDGSDLKQLTDSMWNDTHPAWLPNGRIVFVSERDAGQTRCSGRAVPCTILYGMMGDGSDIVRFSYHETTEWHPSVDNNGMIVYTRWDYVDRDSDVAHHPWLCFPDGRNPRAFHGNYPRKRETRPWMEMNIRAIPNSPLYMATAAAHHGQAYGSMVLVDPRESDDWEMKQVKRVTPEYFFPESEDLPGKAMTIGRMTRNKNRTSYIEPIGTPWPLSEKYYLAVYARSGEESYGIYLCDMWGNKELLYREEGMSALHPIPFVPRKRPPILQNDSKLAKADRPAGKPMPTTGEVAINDVYQSVEPWPKGSKLKELRVVVVFPKETYEANDPKVGVADQSLARGSLGTVPVEDDGSVYFTMPAGCEFYMQVLDEKGMAVQSMRSGTYVHPGEKMSCVGCHEPKHTGSLREGRMPKAFMRPPSVLKSEGTGTFPITFPRLVQPVLDKHCVTCHDENRTKGKKQVPSLRAVAADKRGWSDSYSALTKGHGKTDSIAWSMCGGNGVMEHHKEIQYSIPGEIGAFKSNLYKMLSGGHKGVKLSPEEMRRITCWLDCNSVFYGAYQEAPEQAKGALVWPKLGLPIGFTKDGTEK